MERPPADMCCLVVLGEAGGGQAPQGIIWLCKWQAEGDKRDIEGVRQTPGGSGTPGW